MVDALESEADCVARVLFVRDFACRAIVDTSLREEIVERGWIGVVSVAWGLHAHTQ